MPQHPQDPGSADRHRPRPPYRVAGNVVYPAVDVGRLFLCNGVDALCRVVREGDSQSAWFAVECLDDLADPATTDTLLWCLGVLENEVALYEAAAFALGRLREPRALPLLIDLLRYDYTNITDHQQAAAWALGELGDSRAIGPLLNVIRRVDVADAAFTALGRIGNSDAVPELLDRLGDIWWYSGLAYAARALGDLADPRAISALTGFLRNAQMSPDVRRAAAAALGRIHDRAVIEPLIEALADHDDQTAQLAADAVGRINGTLPYLLRALGASDGATRGGACYALGILSDSSATDPLGHVLAADPDPVVRRTAATALGRLGGPEATAALLRSTADPKISDTAAAALAGLSHPPITELVALLKEGVPAQRQTVATALGQLAAFDFVGELIDALHDDNPQVRTAAIDALARKRSTRALQSLSAVLQDEEERGSPRARAARALGTIGDTAAVDTLLYALGDDVEAVRLRSAEALGRIGDERAISALSEAARRDRSREVRSASVGALGEIGRPATAALESLLDEATGSFRIEVIRSLGRCGDSAAVQALARFISEENLSECLAAVQALATLQDPSSVESLIRALSLPWIYSEIHEAALDGLSLLDDHSAIEAVLDYYINRLGSHKAVRRALNVIASRQPDLSWLK
jgi:HEAT repeat protein